MHNFFSKFFKATIINLIVALFVLMCIIGAIDFFFGAEIEMNISLINRVSVVEEKQNEEIETVFIEDEKKLENYPEYGSKYAQIKIPTIDVDLPVYFGESLNILKNGVGHSSGSYFPGEGGTIIFMGHNFPTFFRRFSELKIGDNIKVETTYGNFSYKIYDMQIVNEQDTEKLPIQKDKEILMIYTCYPFNNIGYATQRYVVYADLIEQY